MPCEILVVAVAKPRITKKGFPLVIKDTPATWGTKEALPNWIKVRITDATKTQVQKYLDSWHKDFVYSILGENDQGYRIQLQVDPSLISVSGSNASIRPKLKDYLVRDWGASIVSHTTFTATVDIPKPVDLREVKAGISDIFKERVSICRYYFSSSDVDFAVANGGLVELTKAQVLSRIIDRFKE